MSWWKTAQVGDKVVCVEAVPKVSCSINEYWVPPEENRIYTIEEVIVLPLYVPEYLGCNVALDIGMLSERKARNWCYASQFRPLTSRPTSIEVFHRILRKHSEPVDA